MERQHVHCIGIGGIGVGALARFYHAKRWKVTGSDPKGFDNTDELKKIGIPVATRGIKKGRLPRSVNLVIHTVASPQDTYERRELSEAKRRKIRILSYPQAVGELTRRFTTIAVAGAHGKSTTTGLISIVLIRAGLDPTVIIGTKLREFKSSNFHYGRSNYLVLEADEYRASFLNYTPAVAIITNIDREHLDFYKNIRNIETAFKNFLLGIPPSGNAVLNRDNLVLRRVGTQLKRKRPDVNIKWFSLKDPSAQKLKKVLQIPGRHNVSNALAAYAVGRIFKIPEKTILAALHSYRGAWRRFDYQGLFAGAKIFADYAHHPTEIAATIQGTREKFPNSRIWCVFQPHHYERTRDLFREFTRAFDGCDAVLMLDIYEVAGREKKNKSPKIHSERLAQAIARRGVAAQYLNEPKRLRAFLRRHLMKGDVVLMMGAGSIWEMTKQLMATKGTKGTKISPVRK